MGIKGVQWDFMRLDDFLTTYWGIAAIALTPHGMRFNGNQWIERDLLGIEMCKKKNQALDDRKNWWIFDKFARW